MHSLIFWWSFSILGIEAATIGLLLYYAFGLKVYTERELAVAWAIAIVTLVLLMYTTYIIGIRHPVT